MQMRQRGDQGGNGDLRRAVQNRLLDFLALIQIPVGVLDLHGGIIHQDADGEREPAERHDVDGFSQETEDDDRGQNGQRNGNRNDQRAAPAAQENQDHQAREAGGDDGFADDAAHGGADEDRLIRQGLNFQFRRQRGRDARKHRRECP